MASNDAVLVVDIVKKASVEDDTSSAMLPQMQEAVEDDTGQECE